MDFIIDKNNQYNLPEGAKYSTCPICSEHRRKKAQKCMLLDWKTGLATCQHCGEVIQLHTYKKSSAGIVPNRFTKPVNKAQNIEKTDFIEKSIFKATLRGHNSNEFCAYLTKLFGSKKTNELIEQYYIGTSKHWKGATIFWQIDNLGKVHTGKIMLYDARSGKRVKEPFSHITWAHKVLNLRNFNLKQCFFGEHLLNEYKPVAIVESEKTAIIASAYVPKFNWIAVGSLNNLNTEKCKVLKGKRASSGCPCGRQAF